MDHKKVIDKWTDRKVNVVDQNALFDVQRARVHHKYRSSGECQNALVVLRAVVLVGSSSGQQKVNEVCVFIDDLNWFGGSFVDLQMRFVHSTIQIMII